MIPLTYVLFILFAHWVGDFIFQTDWQAKNKSKNNVALTKHVATYTATMFVAGAFLIPSLSLLIAWTLVNGVLHWGTDYLTSRLNSYLWAKGDVHNFFVSVGYDQFVHYVCLLFSLYIILQQV